MQGKLFVIATPIGNLDDVSPRALRVMSEVDLLLCEDTRVTRKLLSRHGIGVPVESYREQVHFRKIDHVADLLLEGKDIGIVSDAGTPAISDPGSRLVRDILVREPDIEVIAVPGPCAAVAALSVSGFHADRFVFLGFPPHKKGRARFFQDAMGYSDTVVLYESTHRIMKALEAIRDIDPERKLCVARELTKMHETLYRGNAGEVIAALEATSTKGEFVIIIQGNDA